MNVPRTLVLATRNRDKVLELGKLFAELPLDVRSVVDFPDVPEVIEDGKTLEANALKKARAVAEATGQMSLADDTGLFVTALDGAPGVFAARYAGEDCTYEDNCRKLADELAKLETGQDRPLDRGAEFVTVMAMVDPVRKNGSESGPKQLLSRGVLPGKILPQPQGTGGFGYDPLFELPGTGQTLAEISLEQKNRISHRAKAAEQMRLLLNDYLTA